jgi:hypothetical protein
MMMGIFRAFISGQLLSRAGGHYKILGIVGIAVMCVGMFFLSRMNVETKYSTAVVFMIVTGLGLGTSMPVFTIGVQNAVPINQLGVATSATTFFRSIGGSVGLAILGSVMSNRFAAGLLSKMPDAVKASIPPEALSSLANNPQALVSPDAQTQLREMFNQASSGDPSLFAQFLDGLRQALASAISEVFVIGLAIVFMGLIATFFLKEIPLRKKNEIAKETSKESI